MSALAVEKLIRPELLALAAYKVHDASGLIKLDAMENPYPLPEALKAQWLAALADAELNRYPLPRNDALLQQLADYWQVPASAQMMLGNGSDELIQLLAMTLAKTPAGERGCMLSMEPGFVMYRLIAEYVNMDYVPVPLQAGTFELDVDAVLAAIEQHQPALVFLAYPNNPTGNAFDADAMHRILAAAPGLVVVDEAYHAFAEHSFMPMLEQYDNLLVMRTLSKLGLAGLRLGGLAGAPRWIEQIDKLRLPYNINALTQMSVQFLLAHVAHFEAQAAAIRADRQKLAAELIQRGLTVWPSQANFLLFKIDQAPEVFSGLSANGVLIRNLSAAHELLADCLRVTVGSPEENQAFLDALDFTAKELGLTLS